ncbi:hypothetical protein U27_03531 [Candidatus Vecturithrix granuli]|uniref:ComF family protein n=1 Tax=Vecturithrix granuli TaxID=1499967 RepID=A0A081BW64_VECG1|nr:hypothetical protein U27_03531 [Candidatus Vecturithrix granuli]
MTLRKIPLKGNWRAGWALDIHTVSSSPRPDGGFDTVRTEIGEVLYQLKYRYDKKKIAVIAETAAEFIKSLLVYKFLGAIIPIPPSNLERPFQPVLEIALEIGRIISLPVPLDYLIKQKQTIPLKGIEDHESRREQLEGAFHVKDQRFKEKYVLLFDDLYRSGETLMAATDALYKEGKVARVFVVTLTKTRTKR